MPTPPPPAAASLLRLTLLCILTSLTTPSSHSCTSPTAKSPCPPFTSPLSFPFSSTPGCGHPSFQIKCSVPHSLISINNITFSILKQDLTSGSLVLSPQPINKATNCTSPHFTSIPSQSINLAGSPFRASDSSCSRVSLLRPCLPPNLPNCSHCSWQCMLIKNPLRLLQNCGSTRTQVSDQGCQSDILGFIDNLLKLGIEVEWAEDETEDIKMESYFSRCKTCKASNGVCGYNASDSKKEFLCFQSRGSISPPWINQNKRNHIVIISLVLLITSFLIAVSVCTIILGLRKRKLAATEEDPTILFLHRHRSDTHLPPVFTYDELETSTNRFDPKRKIGDGGFGTVFLGQLYDGRIVAVKHLHRHHPTTAAGAKAFSMKSFCNEILILSTINHPNLVKLHGYCSDPRGLLLVYDYVPNGTLADHLHGVNQKGFLSWQVRVDIALQIAMAIEYLHFSVVPPIVHRDVTSSNVFIEKDMRVKVGDFGLSRLLRRETASDSSECVWTGPQGTPGYLDPDYYTSFRLTEKSDIYSFGVVLLELITGMKAVDQRREKRDVALADLAVSKIQIGLLQQLVDPVLVEAMEGVGAMAELAFRCVAEDKDDRPDAREVVGELRRIRNRTRGGSGLLQGSSSGNILVPVPGT